MESFFATLKKEKLYRIQTGKMPMAQVKSVVFRYIMTYYNRERIYTANPGGLAPAMYRQAVRGLAA
jgi:transposase InsO family protein